MLRISFLIFFFSGLAFLERRLGTAGSGLPERRLNRPPLSPLLRLQKRNSCIIPNKCPSVCSSIADPETDPYVFGHTQMMDQNKWEISQ
jgi:hypothetical protein